MCIQFRGIGRGLGLTPLPNTPQYAIVADKCPGGCVGHTLDIAMDGDGIWDAEWSVLAFAEFSISK